MKLLKRACAAKRFVNGCQRGFDEFEGISVHTCGRWPALLSRSYDLATSILNPSCQPVSADREC